MQPTERPQEAEEGKAIKAHIFSPNAVPFELDSHTVMMEQNEAFQTIGAVSSIPSQVQAVSPIYQIATSGSRVDSLQSGNKKDLDKEGGLSIHAKPWSPVPVPVPVPGPAQGFDPHSEQNEPLRFNTEKFEKTDFLGKQVVAPAPVTDEVIGAGSTFFVHSTVRKLVDYEDAMVEFIYYLCSRCPLKTLFGKLSSRKADVILRHVAADVPPLCIAHLLEQVTKTKVSSIFVADTDGYQLDVWLEKPNLASHVISILKNSIWTCPMYHGYAILARTVEGELSVWESLQRYRYLSDYEQSAYPLQFVEASDH